MNIYQPIDSVKEEKTRTSNNQSGIRRGSEADEDHANQVFSLEETICELQASLEKERQVKDMEVTSLRRAKKSLYDEVFRLKIDRDTAALQLEEEERKHLKELDNMKIALEILKKRKSY